MLALRWRWIATQDLLALLGKTLLAHGGFLESFDDLGEFLVSLLFLNALLLDHHLQLPQTPSNRGDAAGGFEVAGPQERGAKELFARVEQNRALGNRISVGLLLGILQQLTAPLEFGLKRSILALLRLPGATRQQQGNQDQIARRWQSHG